MRVTPCYGGNLDKDWREGYSRHCKRRAAPAAAGSDFSLLCLAALIINLLALFPLHFSLSSPVFTTSLVHHRRPAVHTFFEFLLRIDVHFHAQVGRVRTPVVAGLILWRLDGDWILSFCNLENHRQIRATRGLRSDGGRRIRLSAALGLVLSREQQRLTMKWLERILGPSDHRRYGDNEYYEYPRNGVCMPESSTSWESSPAGPDGAQSWRGPSIFEDPYVDVYQTMHPSRGNGPQVRESSHSYHDEPQGHSRGDTSKYVSQYGGTTEIYNPASGWFRESGYGLNLDPPAYGDRRYKTAEDYDIRIEDLARTMKDTLNLRYPDSYGTTPAMASHASSRMAATNGSVGMSTCAGCHRSLGLGRFLTCINQNWHPSCFRCRYCQQTIVEKTHSMQGSDPYHRDCYKKLFHPKCEICYHHIPLNARGQIEYRSHPFWNQRYCPSHERDGSRCCCSCDRIEPVDGGYKSLEDERKVCSECMESAIMTTKNCQPLYRDILKFYRANLGMPVKQEIPMLLVERETLNNAREVEKDGHTHTPETRGLCLSEEQIFPAVDTNDSGGFHKSETRVLRHCEVTAILVLYGLPRLLIGSILAHELMHAWIRLDGRFPNLENSVEEGICQVIAHIWLKAELEAMRRSDGWGGSSAVSNRLGEFFLHQIETDASPVYGDGFRAASKAVSVYGFSRVIHHLRQTGEILR